MFAKPNGFPYSDFGAYMGATKYSTILSHAAIKGKYSHFHHFGIPDAAIGFPYTALRTYEAQQIAAGKPRIFITATYQGKRRPVIDRGSLQLDGYNRPTVSSQYWIYPVNVRDSRFINFWITKYARPVVLQPMAYLGNAWVYVDGATLTYDTYGVLDDNNRFVAGVRWDYPFPQNGTDYQNSVATFFNTVKATAPDVKFVVDTGALPNPGAFSTTYASVPGFLTENVYGWHSSPSSYTLNHWYTTIFQWYAWIASQGRVSIIGAFLPSNYDSGALVTSFSIYELLKGVNSFFAPRVGGTAIPITSGWMGWCTKLGTPVSAFQSTGTGGYRFFSRHFYNGYVYVNWTGTTRTVTLPSGTWYDRYGNRVTRLTIPTWTGTFVNR
jgi:hypothetical protein